jgi:hypothetical protein
MRGVSGARLVGGICALAALAVLAAPAAAFEFFDDRLAIHGFYEQQIRAIGRDFGTNDDWDLTQWYHVLNLEIEGEIAPDGWGPFDLISAFGRVEVRYDCVWRRACGIFSSADAYGDRAKRVPKRVLEGRRWGYVMQGFDGNTKRFRKMPFDRMGVDYRDYPQGSRELLPFGNTPGPESLSASKGPDGMLGTDDDPFPYFTDYLNEDDCLFAVQRIKGSYDGVGARNLPWNPKCRIRPIGPMSDRANPLRAGDFNPATRAFGSGALPMRPAPRLAAGPLWSRGERAQGVWLPDERLAQFLRDDEFDSFDQNFRQRELEWNRGASQQDEKELKELYLDLELFDSRLWLRIGKQSIVWGKTELFRTTDQFNPQDLALASLPSLEESRIALWAARAVWSFYNVGPLEDVRFEVAMNYDQFEPTDLGRCGEPYAPLPVCDKTYGLMAHGFTGVAIAGEIRPPNPWNSWKGIEVGGRLEWRYDRFSFALTDFYGYNDAPYIDPLFQYSRNVDPRTGRPRQGMSTGSCTTGREPSCLTEDNALAHHSAGQTQFHFVCATSIGFISLDTTACGQSIFNSQNPALGVDGVLDNLFDPNFSPTVAVAFGAALSGQDPDAAFIAPITGGGLFLLLAAYGPSAQAEIAAMTAGHPVPAGVRTPLVPLVVNDNDGDPAFHPITAQFLFTQYGLSRVLTDEQEALLGCGPFYGTNCDIDGIDLMNAEASALMQSFPIFEGTFVESGLWLTTDARRAQPGTVGFQGGPVCTRFERGRTFILPGCRGPGDRGYDEDVDGSIEGDPFYGPGFEGRRVHPFTGQRWASEMGIVSWNMLMVLVALSFADDPDNPQISEFDPRNPFRKDGCSFAAPLFCANVAAYDAISGVRRNVVRAGGNGRYGRRDLIWHGGGNLLLRYEKRNVLGFSMDFAEDFTKTNWGFELTWIEGMPDTNNNAFDATSEVDYFNLTISVDRPTFVNFLNQNRTFFFNSQWFFQYVDGYEKGFTSSGPWNALGTFTITTGYFQDRLLPSVTFVYDVRSNSGAALPEVTYRFTENFSASFGVAGFWGRWEKRVAPLYEIALGNRVGRGAYKSFVENGLSAIRERDEIWLRLRYTF